MFPRRADGLTRQPHPRQALLAARPARRRAEGMPALAAQSVIDGQKLLTIWCQARSNKSPSRRSAMVRLFTLANCLPCQYLRRAQRLANSAAIDEMGCDFLEVLRRKIEDSRLHPRENVISCGAR
jgi:hypothetical protein